MSTNTPELCIKCPICRETIMLPRSGVNSFPPSFIVNQLIDLVGRQRRDLVPRCTNHTQEELLFCETCDSVFCSLCENHCRVTQNSDHIVIPFSIAIKRMSEILLFKSNQCVNSFNLALANVNREIEKLDDTVEQVAENVHKSFNSLKALIDKCRDETLANLCKIRDQKTKLLREQMQLISQEKQLVQNEGKHYENKIVDVRFLSQNISSLNQKLDCLRSLCEPRENSFITYECKLNDFSKLIANELKSFGTFKTSNTYPPLCTASFEQTSAYLKTKIHIKTVDYHGIKRVDGGDPLTVNIIDPSGKSVSSSSIEIIDELNGKI
jgi:tripartite motif-containing protein 2/3